MITLPFSLPPSEGTDVGDKVIQAPPIVHATVVQTPDWQDTSQDISAAAQQVVNGYLADIRQFFLAQRQIRNAGSAQNHSASTFFQGLDAHYQNLQGTETLTLVVRPSSSTGGAEIATGDVLDIDIPFNGWPLLGWDYSQVGGPDDAGGWTIGTRFGSYFFDPGFVSSNEDAPTPVLVAGGNTWNALGSYPFNYYEWGYNDGFFNFEFDISPFTSGGLVEQWWQTDIGGSGIAIQPLQDQQYFEVKIINLPTGVPDQIQINFPGTDDGTYYHDDCLFVNGDKVTVNFPEDLNTFWNPSIGVIPQQMINPNWKKNLVAYGPVLGCDDLTETPRSVFLTRTSYKTGTVTTKIGNAGYYYYNAGGQQILCYDNPFNSGDPDAPDLGTPPVIEWGENQLAGVAGQFVTTMRIDTITTPSLETPYSAAGLTVEQCNEAIAAAIASGFPIVFSDLASHAAVMIGNTGNAFYIAAEVGQPYTVNFGIHAGTYTMEYQEGTNTTTHASIPLGDVFLTTTQRNTGNIMTIEPTFDYDNYFQNDTIPTPNGKLNIDGVHAPILKGRAELFLTNNATGPEGDIPVGQVDSGGNLANGFWTGIDMGDIQEKDVIMVAVDAAARKIWFGKNGKWWDQSGESPYFPGSRDLQPAALLDGDVKTLYYPAASFRLGPTHMQMLFGTACTYLPPAGFKPYGAITFPVPT